MVTTEFAVDEYIEEHLPDHVAEGIEEPFPVETAQAQLFHPFRAGRFRHVYFRSLSVR